MTKSRVFGLMFGLGIAFSGQSDAAGPAPSAIPVRIPLEDFFRNPQTAAYRISPDGKWLATLKPFQSRMNVFVQPSDLSSPPRQVTSVTDRDISQIVWKGNDRVLFTKDFGGDENYHVFVVDIASKEVRDLTPFTGRRAGIVDELNNKDEAAILVTLNKDDPKLFDVYRIDVKTGEMKLEAKNSANIMSWITDHRGRVGLAVSSDGVNQTLYRVVEGGRLQAVITTDFKQKLDPVGFSYDDPDQVYMISNLNRDKSALVLFDLGKKMEVSVLYGRDDVDIFSAELSDSRKKLVAAYYATWKNEKKFMDPAWQKVFDDLTALLPGDEISIADHDLPESRFIVRTANDRSRGTFYLYQKDGNRLSKLEDLSPWLRPELMAPMKPVSYQSRDGLTINGYLTLPPGSEGKNLPLVVNPHGGPWSRDLWRYSPEVQFLASRGYAVLQMNFRGSTGYGRRFWESSFKQWGRKMQDDVSAGVIWLTKSGVADAGRVCIYGSSYGGYSALAGLSFTPDLYKCGVSYVGVSNLFTFMETIPPYWEPMKKMLYEMVGDPVGDKALFEAASPVFHAGKIKAALMVAQGAKDPRVNKAESDQIVAAVKKSGRDVLYMVKDDEGHGFRNEENRMEFFRAMEAFLGKHLDGPAAGKVN